MGLADLPHELIDADALVRAVADGERETTRLDFKEAIDLDGDNAKRELAADVTSMANTAGGVIVLGAREHEGQLVELPGLAGNLDELQQRIESILRSRVDPRLPDPQMSVVEVPGSEHPVLVFSIPRSWRAPHLVRSGERWQLALRNSSGKYLLNAAEEVRLAFLENEDIEIGARRWHQDRVADVIARQTPVPLEPGSFIVVSVRPFAAASRSGRSVLDVGRMFREQPGLLTEERFLRHLAGHGPRPILDGLVITSGRGDGPMDGFTQVWRDASLCYADTYLLAWAAGETEVPAILLSEALVDTALTAPRVIEAVGGSLPATFHVSICGVLGRQLSRHPRPLGFTPPAFTVDDLHLPEVVLDHIPQTPEDAAKRLRPMLDALWNAAGQRECDLFDTEGNWCPRPS